MKTIRDREEVWAKSKEKDENKLRAMLAIWVSALPITLIAAYARWPFPWYSWAMMGFLVLWLIVFFAVFIINSKD